jgi:hypothetical protein
LKKKLFQWFSVTRTVKHSNCWTVFPYMTGDGIWNLLIHLIWLISLSSGKRVSFSYVQCYIRRLSHRSLNMVIFMLSLKGRYFLLV